jgi:hypothetical protein
LLAAVTAGKPDRARAIAHRLRDQGHQVEQLGPFAFRLIPPRRARA